MSQTDSEGMRFSLLYLKPETLIEDSERLRARLEYLSEEFCGPETTPLCRLIRRELGIDIANYYGKVDWGRFSKLPFRDYLDTLTLCGVIAYRKGSPSLETMTTSFNRVFVEERASYTVDPKLGVHPLVDPAFKANFESAVRGLGGADFEAARMHLEKADNSLLAQNDRRDAVRAVFDAVENVFKQSFTGTTSINTSTIQTSLKPAIEAVYADGAEKRAASKQVESLKDWVDACHNYRHEPGTPEPAAPSEELAVLLVSNGIAFTRWLVDIRARRTAP